MASYIYLRKCYNYGGYKPRFKNKNIFWYAQRVDSSYYVKVVYSNVMMFVDMQTCFAKLNKFKTYMQVIGIKNLEVRIEAFETELGCGVYTNSFASLCRTYDVTTMTKAYEAPKVKRETQKHYYLVELSDC